MNVITNSGKSEPFDLKKIRTVIDRVCKGLDVNPLELESRITIVFKDGVKTSDIQTNLIEIARSLISSNHLDWNIVAGRLWTEDRWKKTDCKNKTIKDHINEMKLVGVYNEALGVYSDKDLEWMQSIIDPERDMAWSYSACVVAYVQYIHEKETLHWACILNAAIIASVEEESIRLSKVKEFYDGLSLRKISLASPWWSYLREAGNLASCFITQPSDKLTSITQNWSDAATISQAGGGEGVDLSKIRAFSSEIRGNKNAHQGVTPWIKVLNDIAVAVDQNGKRKGAFTVHLPIWHRDIEDFLEIQVEGTGDIRRKAFDVFPQIGIHDKFMELDASTREWYVFCPYEVKKVLGFDITECFDKNFSFAYDVVAQAICNGELENYKKYDTRDIIKKILKTLTETGLPYICFRDTINRLNPNKHDGNIYCVNLCTESFSNFKADEYAHTCSLGSVVLGEMDSLDDVRYYSGLMCRMLDNGLLLTKAPIEISSNHIRDYKTVGVGMMGMHDWVAKNNLSFNVRNHDILSEVALNMQIGAMEESVKLAKLRGCYPKYKGSEWDNGNMIQHFKKGVSDSSISDKRAYTEKLDMLQTEMNNLGIRNSQMCSPAPNGAAPFYDSIGGVMPNYMSFFLDSKSYTGDYYVYGKFAKENPLCYDRSISRYDQSVLAKYIGKLQKFIDTGISAEYLFDFNAPETSVVDMHDLIRTSWEQGCKAIYYVRFIKVGNTIDSILKVKKSNCLSCEG